MAEIKQKTQSQVWRVLIVEDDESQRKILHDLVEEEGYEAVVCSRAAGALMALEKNDFAAAIFDHRLPDLTGTDLLEQIRQLGYDLRVIIHTGYGSFESAKEAVNLNAYAYVEKLSNPEELLTQLHRAVQEYVADALRLSESQLASLMENVPGLICRLNRLGVVEFINRQEPGLTPIQAVGSRFDEWIAANFRSALRQALEAVYETGQSQQFECLSNQSGRWYACRLGPIRDHHHVRDVILVAHDISERKEAERVLRRSQQELETQVINRTAELKVKEENERAFRQKLTLLHDVNNQLTTCKSVDDLCKMAVELAVSQLGFERVSIWLYDQQSEAVRGTWGVDESGRLRDERHALHKLSTYNSLLEKPFCVIHDAPLFDDSLQPVGTGTKINARIDTGKGVIGVLNADNLLTRKPVSQNQCELLSLFATTLAHMYTRIDIEEQASTHQAELARVARLATVGEMASGLAHELNQPLAAIVNFTQGSVRRMKSKKTDSAEIIQAITNAADQALRAGEIIKRMRSFVKPQEPQQEPVHLNQLIEEAYSMLEGQATQLSVKVHLQLAGNLPQIKADSIQIEQVILNLMLNAFDAMDQMALDQRHLTVKTEKIDTKYIRMTFADTGCGLPDGDLDIFDPFITTKAQGMGMGLSISRSIIQNHDGQLIAEANSGGGACLVCLLPLKPNEDKNVSMGRDIP